MYGLCYKSISFHGSLRCSLPRRTIDIKMTIQAHKETHLLVIFGGLLTTDPRTTYLLGLIHTADITTTPCKPQILQEQINNVFIVCYISEFPDMLVVFWDLC